MPRMARVVLSGMPHHIIQRGNRRLNVFFSDEDRVTYLTLLRNACRRYDVKIWAYCLMRNHVHLIAVPGRQDALARCFADAHVRYTRRINLREGWRGHLWQARFGSSVLDERYLISATRYVERNPVRAGIVREPWQYRWSSAAWHVGAVAADPLVDGDAPLRALISDWWEFLRVAEDRVQLKAIRRESRVSRPLGSESFLKELENRLKRPVRRGKVGRRWSKPSMVVPS